MTRIKYEVGDYIVTETRDCDIVAVIKQITSRGNFRIDCLFDFKNKKLTRRMLKGTISYDNIKHGKFKKILNKYPEVFIWYSKYMVLILVNQIELKNKRSNIFWYG